MQNGILIKSFYIVGLLLIHSLNNLALGQLTVVNNTRCDLVVTGIQQEVNSCVVCNISDQTQVNTNSTIQLPADLLNCSGDEQWKGISFFESLVQTTPPTAGRSLNPLTGIFCGSDVGLTCNSNLIMATWTGLTVGPVTVTLE